jgi:ubiquinone/menaquinone biosynthesis C-methylase UbiE
MTDHPVLPRRYSPSRIKNLYKGVAWFYDSWGKLTEGKASQRLLELADVIDGSRVLEVAVGTGGLFQQLVSLNPSGHVEGVELSPEMLRRARQRMEDSVASASWSLQEADAYDLPFPDASFDLLINAYMLDLLPQEDFPALLGGFRRVLKPGGRLAIASFSRGKTRLNHLWYWLARFAPAVLTDCRPIELGPVLLESGFEIQHCEEISQNTFPSAVYVASRPR